MTMVGIACIGRLIRMHPAVIVHRTIRVHVCHTRRDGMEFVVEAGRRGSSERKRGARR